MCLFDVFDLCCSQVCLSCFVPLNCRAEKEFAKSSLFRHTGSCLVFACLSVPEILLCFSPASSRNRFSGSWRSEKHSVSASCRLR